MLQTDKPVGVPPATLVYTGSKNETEHYIETIHYCEGVFERNDGVPERKDLTQKTWINVIGLTNVESVASLCTAHGVSEMVVEDILNTPTPAKIEEHDDYVFATIKVPTSITDADDFDIQTFNLLIFSDTLITFSEEKLPFLHPIYKRMQTKGKRMQKFGVDYLGWAILDIVTDQIRFFMRLIEERIEELEAVIVMNSKQADVFKIYQLRREISRLHRSIRPAQNHAHQFINMDADVITQDSVIYYNDLKDNLAEIQELADHLLDQSTNMRELYFTINGHRMNQAMKVLAAISVIFLPLSFLAGVFGMNFTNMPELEQPWGYCVAWGLFLVIGISLSVLFKKKGWFD